VVSCDKHVNFQWAQMNVCDAEQITKAIAQCVQAFGSIDVLVNSTGFSLSYCPSILTSI
jgi:NADP-dependent 3-hydroxy acid dehydrogenase YdfG